MKRFESLFLGLRWKTSGSRSPACNVFLKRAAEQTILVARTSWLLYSFFGSEVKTTKALEVSKESRLQRYFSKKGSTRKRNDLTRLIRKIYLIFLLPIRNHQNDLSLPNHLRCSLCAVHICLLPQVPHADLSQHHSGNCVKFFLSVCEYTFKLKQVIMSSKKKGISLFHVILPEFDIIQQRSLGS